MAREYTCCWTDHSNGCPWDDVDKTRSSAEAYAAYLRARISRGYDPAASDEELEKRVNRTMGWAAELKRGVV